MEEVAAEVGIEIAEHRVILDKRGRAAAGRRHRVARIDGAAEYAGVAEIVACRDRQGERRKQRVAVDEGDALARQRRHVGRSRVVDGAGTQTIGDKDHGVMRRRVTG